MFWDSTRLFNRPATGVLRKESKTETSDDVKSLPTDQSNDMDMAQMQKMAMVGVLSAGAMHDINNFLSVIIGSLELYEEDFKSASPDTLPSIKHVNDAKYAARHAAKILLSYMAFSRNGNSFAERIMPEELFSELEILAFKGAHPSLTYSFETQSRARLFLDRNMLVASILNLLINAKQAVNERGSIKVVYRDASKPEANSINSRHAIAITVQDDGCGIAPEIAAQIATPFFTTKASGQGTGLGLSVVKSFAKQVNGDFYLRNGAAGAIATLLLPVELDVEKSKTSAFCGY